MEERDIERLWTYAIPVENSVLPCLDAYEVAEEERSIALCALESSLDDRTFEPLKSLLRAQEKLEKPRSFHYFRQGVLLAEKKRDLL